MGNTDITVNLNISFFLFFLALPSPSVGRQTSDSSAGYGPCPLEIDNFETFSPGSGQQI